jgi:hypothetical protein
MLLQTNSYVVPKDRRSEHARLVRRFRQVLARLGCDQFEVYEQAGSNWGGGETSGRYVQIMRFRDRRHQQEVQQAERSDRSAQALIQEFCDLINFPYQQQQGLFAVGYYTSVLPVAPGRPTAAPAGEAPQAQPSPQPPAPVATDPAPTALSGMSATPPSESGEAGLSALENLPVEDLPDEAAPGATADAGPGSPANGELGELGLDETHTESDAPPARQGQPFRG